MSQLASRISSGMDTNGDGTIDQSEMQRVPERVRERMGLNGTKSISVADYTKKATERFKERMEERETDRKREANSRTSTGSSVFQQSKRQKFTQELPSEYQAGDADEDGQIALFEWAAWKRSDMFAFFEMDGNEDGFLTPRELNDAKKAAEDDSDVAFNRDRLSVASASPSGTSTRGRRGGTTSSSRVRSTGSPDSSSSRTSSARGSSTSDRGRTRGETGTSDRGRSWGGDRGGNTSDRGRSWGGDRGDSTRGGSTRGGGDRGTSTRSWGGDRGTTGGSPFGRRGGGDREGSTDGGGRGRGGRGGR